LMELRVFLLEVMPRAADAEEEAANAIAGVSGKGLLFLGVREFVGDARQHRRRSTLLLSSHSTMSCCVRAFMETGGCCTERGGGGVIDASEAADDRRG